MKSDIEKVARDAMQRDPKCWDLRGLGDRMTIEGVAAFTMSTSRFHIFQPTRS